MKSTYLQESGKNWGSETSSRSLFQSSLYEVKANDQHVVLTYFGRPWLGHAKK